MSREKLSRHNVLLYEGDLDRLREFYPETGAALIIRTLVRKHLKVKAAQDKETLQEIELVD